MHKPILIRFIIPATIVIFQSCKKDPVPEVQLPDPSTTLSSIKWSMGNQKETYEYNNDHSLKSIVFTSGQATDTYQFTWKENKLTEAYETGSLFKAFYHYEGSKVSYITYAAATDPGAVNYKLGYIYRADGKVEKLNLIVQNGPGSNAVTTYHYNAKGELSSTVTIQGEYTITQKIEGYSAPVSFEPWAFIDLTLLENYMIYNYPVLRSMKALPLKVSRSVRIGNDPEFPDTVTSNTFEISHNRINQLKSEFSVPGSPSLNRTKNAVFTYKQP